MCHFYMYRLCSLCRKAETVAEPWCSRHAPLIGKEKVGKGGKHPKEEEPVYRPCRVRSDRGVSAQA